jgi:predicted nucleic acid-binding protein
MVLVDANVLIDVLTDDPQWREWSEEQMLAAAVTDELAINPIIYAELAVAFRTAAALDRVLRHLDLRRLPLPYEAAFLAAQAFLAYRRRDGAKRSPLPDFYIGAHAQTESHRLLTRDTSRYRAYFPKLRLVCP